MVPSAALTMALAAALVVVGGAFDSASLYVPGVGLAALASAAAAWVRLAGRGARVERSQGPRAVVEGKAYPLCYRLGRGLLAPRGELIDPLLDSPVAIPAATFGRLRAGIRRPPELELRRRVRLQRRGRHRLAAPSLLVRDPLGLCSRWIEGEGEGEVLVLPRVEPVLAADGGAGEGERGRPIGEGTLAGPGSPGEVELDGLRPYRAGSPASRIHWPAVARHGELIERRLAAGGAGTAVVVLDSESPASAEALDRAVRAAASLCLHLARAGGCSLVLAGAPRPVRVDAQLRGWQRAHELLALVEPGASLGGGARRVAAQASFWITAEEGGGPPTAARSRGLFLVAPDPSAAGPARFTVAGCAGRLLEAGRARSAA